MTFNKWMPDSSMEEGIKNFLNTNWLGKEMKVFSCCDSTNIRLQEFAGSGVKEGFVVISKEQTLGQGRNGRNWSSPKGECIAISLLLRPEFAPQCASMLTLLAGLSVFSALEQNGVGNLAIKWPNDIVAEGKKICGILTKMCTQKDAIQYVIVGTGINVNQKSFPPELQDIATSVYLQTKEEKSKEKIIADYLSAFEHYYEIFLKTEDLSGVKEEYNQKLVHLNSMVSLMDGEGKKTAKALGINEKGELLVEEPSGERRAILAGEISVRGIEGYV